MAQIASNEFVTSLTILDSPAGTAAGIAADIPVVGVLTSQTVKRMHEAGVFVAVENYHDLLALVKKHVPYDEECDVKYK